MNNMKVQVLLEDDNDSKFHWVDFYFDADDIKGFYVDFNVEDFGILEDKVITIFLSGGSMIIKPEPIIESYLMERFVKPILNTQ